MVFRDRSSANISPGESHENALLQPGRRYRLVQNLAAIADPVLVQTDDGTVAFKIETTQREMLDVLVLRDMEGDARCFISGFQAVPAAAAEVLGNDGRPLARVSRTPISALRDRFEIDHSSGDVWIAIGDVGIREFTLESPKGHVADVSRRWFLLPSSYGVEVPTGQDDALVLAVAVAIDQLTHDFDP